MTGRDRPVLLMSEEKQQALKSVLESEFWRYETAIECGLHL
jgi:hypothetical protein